MAISTKNPFPGMNPYLERSWPDVHTRLLGYICDSLSEDLPDDLHARTEECIAVSADDAAIRYRADVAIGETWKQGQPPVWTPEPRELGGIALAEPEIVTVEPEFERWVEIRDRNGRLITVIELLSPSNKREDGASEYRRKQRDFMLAGVSVVEIDLLRAGQHVLMAPRRALPSLSGDHYWICVTRAPFSGAHAIYRCPLRRRLPVIRIPLRASDQDAPLDLQPLIDRCYEKGRYWQSDFSQPLEPMLEGEDQAWAEELLRAHGLTG